MTPTSSKGRTFPRSFRVLPWITPVCLALGTLLVLGCSVKSKTDGYSQCSLAISSAVARGSINETYGQRLKAMRRLSPLEGCSEDLYRAILDTSTSSFDLGEESGRKLGRSGGAEWLKLNCEDSVKDALTRGDLSLPTLYFERVLGMTRTKCRVIVEDYSTRS
jgi:hypothetical protein